MIYTKTNWKNNETPLNASNMNKIEEGIYINSLNIENKVDKPTSTGNVGDVLTKTANGIMWMPSNVGIELDSDVITIEINMTGEPITTPINGKIAYIIGRLTSSSGSGGSIKIDDETITFSDGTLFIQTLKNSYIVNNVTSTPLGTGNVYVEDIFNTITVSNNFNIEKTVESITLTPDDMNASITFKVYTIKE